jgi:hypothetical protein
MSLFKSVSITVKRKNPGAYVSGRWVEGTAIPDFIVLGTVQPISKQKLQTLPEGKRQSVVYELFTDEQLKAADPLQSIDGDRVLLPDGFLYEVFSVDRWQNDIISHYESIAIREKEIA